MFERLEQLLQIERMCSSELKKAQANCERYSSNMNVLTTNLHANWQDTNCLLTEYDSCVTNITTIMDTTRKFNLHLEMYNTKLSEMHSLFSKMLQCEESQSFRENAVSLKENASNFFPAEEFDNISESVDVEDYVYPSLPLNEYYKANDVIIGTITYIKNLKDLKFYVFDYSCKFRDAVVELSKTLELRQYHGLPKAEVFGCVLDNQIFRAVLGSKAFYDEEMGEEIYPCFLLDTGEVVPLKSDHITYKLTSDQKNIPSLALSCQLMNKNPFMAKKVMEEKLKETQYKKCHIKIVSIECNTLHVQIEDDPNIQKTVNVSEDEVENVSIKTKPTETEHLQLTEKQSSMIYEEHFNTSNAKKTANSSENKVKCASIKAKPTKADQYQLTEEELNMIYEEPLNTSNAMKAVMGYDPQDDKRLCRFYNPLTGGCFKGVNCKLEHTLRQPDGWTKDILPTSSIIDTQQPITIFPQDSIINITPTYIGELDRFFAQVNEPNKTNKPLVWNDEEVPSCKILRKPPHMFQLVLSRYTDGLWYRAKIVSHDDDYKIFKVIYVDYGNIQVVHLRDLASIDIGIAQLPYKAVLCRFENVIEKPSLAVEERKNSIEILCEMILNKSMNVKVVSHYEDLFISFVDKKTFPLPEALVEMGYLEVNKNNVIL